MLQKKKRYHLCQVFCYFCVVPRYATSVGATEYTPNYIYVHI
jgi:hypothetical protein